MIWTVIAAVMLGGNGGSTTGPDEVFRTRYFSFHSDPWMNLHHFLYAWARADAGLGRGRQSVAVAERDDVARLGATDRAAWDAAVAFYRERLAERDILFDRDMLRLAVDLAALEGDPGALPPDDPEGLRAALRAAMPVYRAHWWPAHDRANRAWLAERRALVERHEAAYVADVERAYGGDWAGVLRVDLSGYSNWAGAYTSNGPNHTVMASTDPGNQGLYGLEILFHEAGHQEELEGALLADLDRVFARAGTKPPGNLWHAILFYTAGWVTQRVAREEALPVHEPYAVHEGLVHFGSWTGLWPTLEAWWGPFLDGRISREEALRGLAGG